MRVTSSFLPLPFPVTLCSSHSFVAVARFVLSEFVSSNSRSDLCDALACAPPLSRRTGEHTRRSHVLSSSQNGMACMARPGTLTCIRMSHCRSVVCACSAGTVGSFSNKPLSPKSTRVRVGAVCEIFAGGTAWRENCLLPMPLPRVLDDPAAQSQSSAYAHACAFTRSPYGNQHRHSGHRNLRNTRHVHH